MKKKVLSMMLSAAMLCGTLPAMHASALYCWGTASGEKFRDMQLLDDKGMFQWIGYGGVPGTPRDYQVYTRHFSFDVEQEVTYADTGETRIETTHREGDSIYVLNPRKEKLRIVLRNDLDETEAKQKAVAILRKYYPEMLVGADSTGFPASFYPVSEYTYELHDRSETVGSEEISAAIMKELAEAGLISEFYTWGQIADYQEVWYTYPTAYYPITHKWNSTYTALEDVTYDWNAVEAWVNENYPECEFVCVTAEDPETAKIIGQYDSAQDRVFYADDIERMYAVIPPDGTSFAAHFAIAADLYEQFGLAAHWLCPESMTAPMIGQNALAVEGDANLDCSVDISDAILTARLATEDSTVMVSSQGKVNADCDGVSGITAADAARILKYIAKLN